PPSSRRLRVTLIASPRPGPILPAGRNTGQWDLSGARIPRRSRVEPVSGPLPETIAMTVDRAMAAEQEIGRINAFFPILPRLGNRWAAARPWEGRRIALNLHLTTLTAAFVRELTLGGGTFTVSAANPRTTDPAAVDLVRSLGIDVFTGGDMEDRHLQCLAS